MNRKVTENQALPSGWRAVGLGDVGKIITGRTPSTKKPQYYKNGKYPFVTPTDINARRLISRTGRYLTHEGMKKGRLIPKGSLLVTCIASIGKNAIIDVDGSCNQQINAIIPNKNYDADYLYYVIENESKYLLKYAGKSVAPIINKSSFSRMIFTIPPILTQKAIACLLKKWDTAIEKTESLITAKRQQFGWLVFSLISRNKSFLIKLKDACRFVAGEKFKDVTTKESYLEIGDIDINMKSYNLSNKQKDPISGAVKVPKGTLLISTVRPTRGAITKTQTEIYVSQAFCRLEINNDFIYYCLHQPKFFRFLESRQSGGTYPTVSHRDIMDFKIPDVSPLQQNAIAHTLNTAQREITLLEQLAEKYRIQKKGLMQKLLTGNWRVNNE